MDAKRRGEEGRERGVEEGRDGGERGRGERGREREEGKRTGGGGREREEWERDRETETEKMSVKQEEVTQLNECKKKPVSRLGN